MAVHIGSEHIGRPWRAQQCLKFTALRGACHRCHMRYPRRAITDIYCLRVLTPSQAIARASVSYYNDVTSAQRAPAVSSMRIRT